MSSRPTLSLAAPGRRLDVRSLDGTRLNVEIYGPDDGPSVLFSHGWTCSIRFWTKQVEALVADGVRVIVHDLRGHGASAQAGPAGYTPEALADDLSEVLYAALPPGRRTVLAGHSMGSMGMIAFGARHPQELERRIAAALITSTGMRELAIRSRVVPLPLPLARLARPISDRLMAWSPAGDRPTRRQWQITKYASLSRTATDADVEFCIQMINACPAPARAGFARMLTRIDLDDQTSEFDVPTIVLAGTHDRLTPIWHARRLADTLPRLVDLIEVPGAGHMTPVQSATEVNAALSRLVRDHLTPIARPVRPNPSTVDASIKTSEMPDPAQETA
jgi:pimeloyl-ACP methyl ester carboxylesterase